MTSEEMAAKMRQAEQERARGPLKNQSRDGAGSYAGMGIGGGAMTSQSTDQCTEQCATTLPAQGPPAAQGQLASSLGHRLRQASERQAGLCKAHTHAANEVACAACHLQILSDFTAGIQDSAPPLRDAIRFLLDASGY